MRQTGWMILTYVVAAAIALGMNAGGLHAQAGGPGAPRPGFGGRAFGANGRGEFGFGVAGCLNSGKTVAGEGYTGTLSYEQVKPVLNGAPIDHTITETIARDNDGRTQREITLPPFPNAPQGSPHQVTCINDPVAGFGYMLDATKMTARQFKLHQWKPNSADSNGANPQTNSANANGPRPLRGPNANVASVSLQSTSAPAVISKECPGVTGTQITRGVNIPGNNGQSTPIQIITTRWYCPTLSMNLETQTNDPLQGITTTTITITGAGPAAISVPTGYKIITSDAGPRARGPRPGGPPPAQ
jgi:hypothetical protein